MRSYFGLAGFVFSVIVALLADLQGGVRSPRVLIEMIAGMVVGIIIMFDLDIKLLAFLNDLGRIRVKRIRG